MEDFNVGWLPFEEKRALKDLRKFINTEINFKKNHWLSGPGYSIDDFENPHVKYLSLENCGMYQLPKSVNNLKHLEYLNLSSNNLKSVSNISNLKNLKSLIVSKNPLRFLGSNLPERLKNLKADYCVLNSIPDDIGLLKRLKHLSFQNNELLFLPDSIGDLKRLETLNLSYNKLNYLPDSIGELIRLNNLNISCNNLYLLPHTFGYLHNLVTLNLNTNKLNIIPFSVICLKNLKNLYVKKNPLKSPYNHFKLPASAEFFEELRNSLTKGLDWRPEYLLPEDLFF